MSDVRHRRRSVGARRRGSGPPGRSTPVADAAADRDDWTRAWWTRCSRRGRAGLGRAGRRRRWRPPPSGCGLSCRRAPRPRRPSAAGSADLPMAAGADTVRPDGSPGGADGASTARPDDRPGSSCRWPGRWSDPGCSTWPPGRGWAIWSRRAGGLAADADADRVDLAAPLADGALVYIPRRGETRPARPGRRRRRRRAGRSARRAPASAVVDLNTATAAQLDSLPGVGPATAAAIVAYRRSTAPSTRIDDLAEVSGIGPAKLAQIRPHVHV